MTLTFTSVGPKLRSTALKIFNLQPLKITWTLSLKETILSYYQSTKIFCEPWKGSFVIKDNISFEKNIRLTVKIFQFLQLSTNFCAVLRLLVNPTETLLQLLYWVFLLMSSFLFVSWLGICVEVAANRISWISFYHPPPLPTSLLPPSVFFFFDPIHNAPFNTSDSLVPKPVRAIRVTRAGLDRIAFCAFYSFFSGSPNECWLHTCDACVLITWRLGLRAPLVAGN